MCLEINKKIQIFLKYQILIPDINERIQHYQQQTQNNWTKKRKDNDKVVIYNHYINIAIQFEYMHVSF